MWNVTFALVSCKLLMNRRNYERSPQHLSASSPLLQQSLRGNRAVFSIWPVWHTESGCATFCCCEITHGCINLFISNPLPYPVTLLRKECLGGVEEIGDMQGVDVSVDQAFVSYFIFSASSMSYTLFTDVFGISIAAGITPFRCSQILCVLEEFISSFAVTKTCFFRTSTVTHKLGTGSHPGTFTSSLSLICCRQSCPQCASPRRTSPPSN